MGFITVLLGFIEIMKEILSCSEVPEFILVNIYFLSYGRVFNSIFFDGHDF